MFNYPLYCAKKSLRRLAFKYIIVLLFKSEIFTLMTKPHLLAVDDEQDNLDLIQRALRTEFDVSTSLSGKDALRLFEDKDFTIILSDQRMPEMTGVDFLKESLKRQPTATRILITGYSDIESVIDAVNKGSIHRYIKKPWRKDELIREIQEALQFQRLVFDNQRMVEELRDANEKLEAQQLLLQKNLDERSRELFEANQRLTLLNEKLKSQSTRDGLTDLYNHISFQQKLRDEMERARQRTSPLSLLFLDVDHFKNFNDKNGHPAGDDLLKTLASLLTKSSRADNTNARNPDIVARYGGEEFAVILPDTPFEGAMIKAERIRKAVHQLVHPGMESQPSGRITVSVGVASYPEDAIDSEKLIEHADRAMYVAKHQGRNQTKAFRELDSVASTPSK